MQCIIRRIARGRLYIRLYLLEEMVPDILVLDEPMNGLDDGGIEDMRKLILEFRKPGKIVLIASHNKEDISILCDKVYRVSKGQLKEQKNEE